MKRLLLAMISLVFVVSMARAAANTMKVSLPLEVSATTDYPLRFARVFIQGEIPHYPQIYANGVALKTQANVKSRWPDRTVKHCILSAILPSISSNVVLTFKDQSSGNTTPLTKTEMLAARYDFDATIRIIRSTTLTASARAMLNTGAYTEWAPGQVAQTIILADHSADRVYDLGWDRYRSFRPIFEATFWPRINKVYVRYIGENSNTETLQDLSYSVALTIGSANPTTWYMREGKKSVFSIRYIGRGTSCTMNLKLDTEGYEFLTTIVPDVPADNLAIPVNGSLSGLVASINSRSNGKYRVAVIDNSTIIRDNVGDLSFITDQDIKTSAYTFVQDVWRHCAGTRWTRTHWIGAQPVELNLDHNLAYLTETKALPNYDASISIPGSALTYAYSSWNAARKEIGDAGEIMRTMNAGGLRNEIGPFPTWDVRWAYTGDYRARAQALGNCDLGGSWPLHFREGNPTKANFGKPMSIMTRPDLQVYRLESFMAGTDAPVPVGPVASGSSSTSMGWKQESNHIYEFNYVPYLLTGEHWYFEQMAMWNEVWVGNTHPITEDGRGRGPTKTSGGSFPYELRGMAWSLRSRVQFHWIMPDDYEKGRYQAWIDDMLGIWEGFRNITKGHYYNSTNWKWGRTYLPPLLGWISGAQMTMNGGQLPPLGQWYAGSTSCCQADTLPPYGMNTAICRIANSQFEQFYMMYSLGRAAELGYNADKLRDDLAVFFVNGLTDPSFNPYAMGLGRFPTATKSDPTHYIRTWADALAVFDTAHGYDFQHLTDWFMATTRQQVSENYPFMLMAATSYTGSSAAWDKVKGLLTHPYMTAYWSGGGGPKWAILPRWFETSPAAISPMTGGTVANVKIVNDRWPDPSSLKTFAADSVRILGAVTEEEKALAVFRMVRMFTSRTDGNDPDEPATGNRYITEGMRILNVYGAHWCDGLVRAFEQSYRAIGGRAEKLYIMTHTQADAYWTDLDGIGRWHLFDVSNGWFARDRTGKHLASPLELGTDASLTQRPSVGYIAAGAYGVPGLEQWTHSPHLAPSTYSSSYNLRQGESVTFYWGNVGKPYQKNWGDQGKTNFEHGPYTVGYGNAVFEYTPDFTSNGWRRGFYNTATNVIDKSSPAIHPATAAMDATFTFRIQTPYIISGAQFRAQGTRGASDTLRIDISTDNGGTWVTAWTALAIGAIDSTVDFGTAWSVKSPPTPIPNGNPFGRYSYLVRVKMNAAKDTTSVGLSSLKITTTVQNNQFALPMLWPGTNIVTTTSTLGTAVTLRQTFTFQDAAGKDQQVISTIEANSYTHAIPTIGKRWADVKCVSLKMEAIARVGSGSSSLDRNITGRTITTVRPQDEWSVNRIAGKTTPPALKTSAQYITDLSSETSGTRLAALYGLSVLRDATAYASVFALAKNSTDPEERLVSLQTMNFSNAAQARADYRLFLVKDPSIAWRTGTDPYVVEGDWAWVASQIAGILMQAGRTGYATEFASILDHGQVVGMHNPNRNNWEPYTSIVRYLASAAATSAIPAILKWTNSHGDMVATVIQAFGDMGATAQAATIRNLYASNAYEQYRLYGMEALAKLGDTTYLSDFRSYATLSADEDYRGYAATALGTLRDTGAASILKNALSEETFPWVKDRMQAAIRMLTETH